MNKTIFLFSTILILSVSSREARSQDSSRVVFDWVKQHAIPINSIEPGTDLSDLGFLNNVLKDVKIVGLGESTHGTREFVKIRHRIIQYLVTNLGFTALMLESSFSDCEPINDYILYGKGSLDSALTLQGYSPWDNEEFKSMLQWLRSYNTQVAPEKKVHFYGIDIPITFQKVGRAKVRIYIEKYAPEKLSMTDSIFNVLGDEDHGWPTRLDKPALQNVFPPLHELIRYVNTNKTELIHRSSPQEWEETRKHLEVMEQGLFANVDTLPPALAFDSMGRDDYMAKNMIYLIEARQRNAKYIFWAHDYHVSTFTQNRTVGFYLRERYGDNYYALGLECNEGIFETRKLLPDGKWGDFAVDTLSGVKKPVTDLLKQMGAEYLFVDWRPAFNNFWVDKWLDTPAYFGDGWAKSRKTEENFNEEKVKGMYDGFLFIGHSTPTHPTSNALARSAVRIGF